MKLKTILKDNVAINVAEHLDKETRHKVVDKAAQEFEVDILSRAEWKEKHQKAMKMAMQVVRNKMHPWPGAANIKYPLILTAALQFNARAYPALMNGYQPVTAYVVGEDPEGDKLQKAEKVGKHMSWQLLYRMEDWEEDMDRMLIALPIVGCLFKKTYYDADLQTNVSRMILPQHLVVNYYASKLDNTRKSEILVEYKNDVITQQRKGLYRECDLDQAMDSNIQDIVGREVADLAAGQTEPGVEDSSTPYVNIEHHGYYDLDGDGYEEPYIITFNHTNRELLRMVPRFTEDGVNFDAKGRVIEIIAEEFFTKFGFIPNPDGGFYDVGFGQLLGPISATVDATINQLLDAGTLSNLPGGFLGRGIRTHNRTIAFKPGQWEVMNSSGKSLKDNIVPLPIKEPSAVLLNLLSVMLKAAEDVSATKDILMGENPGQNQKVGTSQLVHQEAYRMFTSIYKRIRRALGKEFKKLFYLNSLYLDETEWFRVLDSSDQAVGQVRRVFYDIDSLDIEPASDPSIAIKEQKIQLAEALLQTGATFGNVNIIEAQHRLYSAMEVPSLDTVFPTEIDETGQRKSLMEPPQNPELILAQSELNMKLQDLQRQAIKDTQEYEVDMRKLEVAILEIITNNKIADDDQALKAQQLVDNIAMKIAELEQSKQQQEQQNAAANNGDVE